MRSKKKKQNKMQPPYDYRQFLKSVFLQRKARNPRYSSRAFARDLGIRPDRLSKILNRKSGTSSAIANKIMAALALSPEEQTLFIDSVTANHSKSKLARERSRLRLKKQVNAFKPIDIDSFKLISDWYHFAFLEMLETLDPPSNPSEVAQKLSISMSEAKMAIERLVRLGYLAEQNGRWISKESFVSTSPELPSEVLRKANRESLSRALLALDQQGVEERYFTTAYMAVKVEELPRMKKRIHSFVQSFGQKASRSAKKNVVYCLSLQFYNAQKVTKK